MANNSKKGPPVGRLASKLKTTKPEAKLTEQGAIRTMAPNSPVYPQVKTSLDTWSASADTLAALVAKRALLEKQLSELRTQLHDAEGNFDIGERVYRGAVQMAAAGQPTLIESLGYRSVVGRVLTTTILSSPTGLAATIGVDPGSAHLKWLYPQKGHGFAVEMSPDPLLPTSWKSLPGTNHRSLKVGDLVPGQRYWFRVAALGQGTQSSFCEPVSIVAR